MPDPNIKILVVDDFKTMRSIVKGHLIKLGYKNLVEATDGVKAIEMIERGDIEFIVSDWNMPEMDGLELLQHVRRFHETKDLPFLMVTAEAEKGRIIEAIKAGVSNYIVKPFTTETLKEKITAIFKE